MERVSNKTRNLSIFEFLDVLQKEFICCELRFKTYTHERQREYWRETGEKKKEKIQSISQKHNLRNILDDQNIYRIVEFTVLGEFGFPKFIYKDENQKQQIQKWDVLNYYSSNCDVLVKIGDETKNAKAVKVEEISDNPIVLVDVQGQLMSIKGEFITRIF